MGSQGVMEDREKCDRVPLTFVVPVNDRAILEKNLLLSPGLKRPDGPRLLVQEGFRSAAAAYNNAIDKATNDFVIFVHQDVYLPESWLRSEAPRWAAFTGPRGLSLGGGGLQQCNRQSDE